MHILLVGPGALGCLLAAAIAPALDSGGDRLTLLDHNRDRAALLNQRGIHCDADGKEKRIFLPVASDPTALNAAGVIILCVKSHDVTACLRACRHLLSEDTLLLFMQNGIAHLGSGLSTGKAAVAFGTTTEGATLLAPGHVRHAGHGTTYIGFRSPTDRYSSDRLDRLATIFCNAGLPTHTTDRIIDRLWSKLFINVGINALTAIHGCTNGELLSLPGTRERMRTAVTEAEMVARASGILVDRDPFAAAEDVCRKTAGNISSMLQDVRRRRRTEIDAINGAVVSAGRAMGIDTPENGRLVRQIKEMEAGFALIPPTGI